MEPGKVNYVFVSSDHLRSLEKEFADGISEQLPSWEDSRTILKPRSGVVNVTFFIYRPAHVMMSHGVADKNYLWRRDRRGGLEVNKYRRVCVPGDWLKNKLLATPGLDLSAEQIKVVGWPRIDSLIRAYQARRRKTPWWQRPGKFRRQVKVLWAPTHAGGDGEVPVSSYPGFLKYEAKLSELFDYSASLHPSLREGGKPTFESLLEADVVVADRGTLVYEAWALGKPVIFPSWLIAEGNLRKSVGSAENHIFREGIGCHAASFDELVDMVRSVRAPDSRVVSFLEEYLPERTRGKAFAALASVVQDVWFSGDLTVKPRVKPRTK